MKQHIGSKFNLLSSFLLNSHWEEGQFIEFISSEGVSKLFVSRLSSSVNRLLAVCKLFVRRSLAAVCPSLVSRFLAVCNPFVSRFQAVC